MSERNYLDPPHELRALVHQTLAGHASTIGRDLRVEFDRQDVILRGAVGSYYHKQVAQESVRRIDGIGAIRNELEVVEVSA